MNDVVMLLQLIMTTIRRQECYYIFQNVRWYGHL